MQYQGAPVHSSRPRGIDLRCAAVLTGCRAAIALHLQRPAGFAVERVVRYFLRDAVVSGLHPRFKQACQSLLLRREFFPASQVVQLMRIFREVVQFDLWSWSQKDV